MLGLHELGVWDRVVSGIVVASVGDAMHTCGIYFDMLNQLFLVLILLFVYVIFIIWYGGRSKPLSQAEVDALLAEMKRRAGKPLADEEAPILRQFRELTQHDDGREYYMVNLLKFRAKALYPAESQFGDDPQAANDRYNRAIVPLLLKRGGHPVFLGEVQGRFIHPDSAEDWDQVGMVRYRSRRDMLKMAVEIAGLGVDVHKWAALEKTHVFPVKPVTNLVVIRTCVALILLMVALLLL